VVSISKNERSFHAFYALTTSGKYGARPAKEYAFLKQSECYQAANMDDQKYFDEINSCMTQIGFSEK
jgi:myosin heavy subunit